jgi:hypothetical protein
MCRSLISTVDVIVRPPYRPRANVSEDTRDWKDAGVAGEEHEDGHIEEKES